MYKMKLQCPLGPASEVTLPHFFDVLLVTRTSPVSVERGLHSGNARRRESHFSFRSACVAHVGSRTFFEVPGREVVFLAAGPGTR